MGSRPLNAARLKPPSASDMVTFVASLIVALALVYLTLPYLPALIQPHEKTAPEPSKLSTPPERPYLIAQSTKPDKSYGKLLLVPISAPDGPAYETDLTCDRAAFAGLRGICLVTEGQDSFTRYAYVLNEQFERLHKIRLAGVPSRVRVSPDGRLAAVSVSEHTHDNPLVDFIARTIIVDTNTGASTDLREFRYAHNRGFSRVGDLGIWGVTFRADSNSFFATLDRDGTKYLVEGDVPKRKIRIVRPGMECPSLSPDNTRIVYKRRVRVDDDARPRVYDLRTGTDVAVDAERRSIVDQVEWVDNDRVMYHMTGERGADVWSVRVDGTEAPKMLRSYAYSPALVR